MSDKEIGIYPLNKNISVKLNEGTELEIKDGKYRLTKSSCKEQICVKMGWCSDESIICLPQKMVIEPLKENEDKLLTY